MSRLSAFLHPSTTQVEREVIVSDRFLDEGGKPVPFKIRAVTQAENEAITKQATRRVRENGQMVDRLDSVDFTRRMLVTAVVEPDFSNTEMCQAYGVLDPLLVPGRMLLAGESSKLMREIMDLSGFNDANIEDTAKN
jgi:hypothetical protein